MLGAGAPACFACRCVGSCPVFSPFSLHTHPPAAAWREHSVEVPPRVPLYCIQPVALFCCSAFRKHTKCACKECSFCNRTCPYERAPTWAGFPCLPPRLHSFSHQEVEGSLVEGHFELRPPQLHQAAAWREGKGSMSGQWGLPVRQCNHHAAAPLHCTQHTITQSQGPPASWHPPVDHHLAFVDRHPCCLHILHSEAACSGRGGSRGTKRHTASSVWVENGRRRALACCHVADGVCAGICTLAVPLVCRHRHNSSSSTHRCRAPAPLRAPPPACCSAPPGPAESG